MPDPITTPQGQGCDNWGAQGICVSWRGSTQERLSSESTFAKVPYKAALEKRLQHSQTSLESSRQATRVSHQKKSEKAIFEWPLAEIGHKRSKNCTKAPRKQAKQECLPKVPPRSLPDSPLSVSCRMCPRNVFHKAKASYSPACLFPISARFHFEMFIGMCSYLACTVNEGFRALHRFCFNAVWNFLGIEDMARR